MKKCNDNRIKANADFTEQKIKLRRAHVEAMKLRVVVVVHTFFAFMGCVPELKFISS